MVYRRTLNITPAMQERRLFLYFEGVNSVADVKAYTNLKKATLYVNGRKIGTARPDDIRRATPPAKDGRSPALAHIGADAGEREHITAHCRNAASYGPHSPFFILARSTSITAGSTEITMMATMSNLRFCCTKGWLPKK